MNNKTKDLYNSKQRYAKWKKNKTLKGLNYNNSQQLIKFLNDMELGLNVSITSKKGSRSYIRLNTLRSRLLFVFKHLQGKGIKDIRNTKAKHLHILFNDMRTGAIQNNRGMPYKSTGDYVKVFKTFWHWYQKISKKKIEDITNDLDTRGEKPKFVYLTEDDFQQIIDISSYDLKPILSMAFDSGARVSELMNIKVSDFSNDFKELNIREEVSKTFGRRIKLMICSGHLREYVKKLELKDNDFICKINPPTINKELRTISKKCLTPEQIKYKNLTLYDFRHSSACFWLPRYKSESALKYRFGWKKSDMIHYYTEFLGMKDTIKQEDLYLDVTKTELEKEIKQLKKLVHKVILKQADERSNLSIVSDLESKGIAKKGETLKYVKELLNRRHKPNS